VYKDEQGERRFFIKDGKIFTQRSGGSAFEVFAAGGERYFYGPASLSYFDLAKGPDGTAEMRFHANGAVAPTVARWTGPVPKDAAALVLAPAELDRMAGSYTVAGATMTIARSANGLTGQLTGQRPIPLEAIGPRELRTVGIDARLVFEEDGGRIVRVVLHQGGRSTPFARQ
jgi:hypothetical protein